jgi:hypothetical protein
MLILPITPFQVTGGAKCFDPPITTSFSRKSTILTGLSALCFSFPDDTICFSVNARSVNPEEPELFLHLNDLGRIGESSDANNSLLHDGHPPISDIHTPESRDKHVGILLLNIHME